MAQQTTADRRTVDDHQDRSRFCDERAETAMDGRGPRGW